MTIGYIIAHVDIRIQISYINDCIVGKDVGIRFLISNWIGPALFGFIRVKCIFRSRCCRGYNLPVIINSNLPLIFPDSNRPAVLHTPEGLGSDRIRDRPAVHRYIAVRIIYNRPWNGHRTVAVGSLHICTGLGYRGVIVNRKVRIRTMLVFMTLIALG